MLRRIKSQVELCIPPKKEVVVQVPMTDIQLRLYQAVLDKNFEILRKLVSYVYDANGDFNEGRKSSQSLFLIRGRSTN